MSVYLFIHSLQTSIWKWSGNSPVGVRAFCLFIYKKHKSRVDFVCMVTWSTCPEVFSLKLTLEKTHSLRSQGFIRSYRKNCIPLGCWSFLFWFRNEPHCFSCAETFLPTVEHSHAVASQSLFCRGCVQVMFVASGKVAPACEWMPLSWALKTWPGSEGAGATSSEEMVRVKFVSSSCDLYTSCKVNQVFHWLYFHRLLRRIDGGEPWRWSRGHWTLQHIPRNGGRHTWVDAASWTGSCQKVDDSYCQHLLGHQGYCFWEARAASFSVFLVLTLLDQTLFNKPRRISPGIVFHESWHRFLTLFFFFLSDVTVQRGTPFTAWHFQYSSSI